VARAAGRRALTRLPSAAVTTVLFVGAGRHQRRAIEQARARGLQVAAVDRNADAPGLAAADVAEVVDFMDVSAVVEVARRIGRPRAARAVGGAVSRNPVGLLVPCHRVIAGDGSLGGYGAAAWGGVEAAL